MKYLFLALLLLTLLGSSAMAQHTPQQLKEDIARHQAMAAAHDAAAKCLAAGNKYEDCMDQLQTACIGLGIGKFCGMKHAH